MHKIGDRIICKDFPIRYKPDRTMYETHENLTIDKSYNVIEIKDVLIYDNITHYNIVFVGDSGRKCTFWCEYFYTKQEMRKQKLQTIQLL